MKRYISAATNYDKYFTIMHGPTKRFGVHYSDGPYEGSFSAQVSPIHAYDDAEYTWAKIANNGSVQFIRDGKITDRMQLPAYEEDDYEEVNDYINDMLDTVAVELLQMNRDVEPRMIHN